MKFNSIMGLGGNYTLQDTYVDEPLTENDMTKEGIDTRYSSWTADKRQNKVDLI